MNKIVFNDGSEIEIATAGQSGNILTVEIDTDDVNSVVEKFRDESATTVMRYYAGLDLIRGYAGFTVFENVSFRPNVVVNINYEETDENTESGFKEERVDRCVVTMLKKSMLASVANQTAQNTANIDYIAMETGVEL